MKEFPLSHLNYWIEPGPIVLVTTTYKESYNVMTMGFHMMMEHEPPLIGCVIGPWDYTFKILKETKECVIAIPTVDLAVTVVDIGNCSGKEIDKMTTFQLTPLPAKKVKAPLIKECLANIECKVIDFFPKYNQFVLKALRIVVDTDRKEIRTLHHNGDGTFIIDGDAIDLKKRMVKWEDT